MTLPDILQVASEDISISVRNPSATNLPESDKESKVDLSQSFPINTTNEILDNVVNDLIVPKPDYERFDSPIFNPVLQHPNDDLSQEYRHFVIRFDVKEFEKDEEVKYTLRNALFVNKKKK